MKVESTLQFTEKKLGRHLNTEESKALARHIYSLEQKKSYLALSGASIGVARWWRTWDRLRIPFYQPELKNIDINKFGPLRGPMAQYARHTWRFALYTLVAGQMGMIIGTALAQPIAAMRIAEDPKLEQFSAELRAVAHVQGEQRAQTGRDIEARRREFQEQVRNRSGGGPSPQASWGRPQSARSDDVDDMSPTAGNDTWASSGDAPTQSWESFSNETKQPAPQRQQHAPSTESWSRRPPPKQSPQSSSSPFDDDASPTGGLFQDEVNHPQSQSQSTSGGSTWDRLRRGEAPTPSQRQSQDRSRRAQPDLPEQRESSTLGDSYTFVESDGERKRERERAQQEFDARLERERQGRDFSGDEGKRW